MDNARIGRLLKNLRLRQCMTQIMVASQLGVNRPAVSLLESGKRRIRSDEIVKLAEIYRISVDDLMALIHDLSDEDKKEVSQFKRYINGELSPEELREFACVSLQDLATTLRSSVEDILRIEGVAISKEDKDLRLLYELWFRVKVKWPDVQGESQ